jgi:hypothetical protein
MVLRAIDECWPWMAFHYALIGRGRPGPWRGSPSGAADERPLQGWQAGQFPLLPSGLGAALRD